MIYERITINPKQMGGVPCIRGLRIPVATVVGMVAERMTDEEILAAYPDLEPDDMEALLLTQIAANTDSMQSLATQRGVAVRDHLARLNIPLQRLFLCDFAHSLGLLISHLNYGDIVTFRNADRDLLTSRLNLL